MSQYSTGYTKQFRDCCEPLSLTALENLTSGVPFVLDSLLLVPLADAISGDPVAVAASGIFEFPKTAPLEILGGNLVYWNATTKKITKTGTDVFAGVAMPASSAATTVHVILSPAMAELVNNVRLLATGSIGG